MLISLLFFGVVYGVVLPHVPRTTSGELKNATSYAAAAPTSASSLLIANTQASITAPPAVPSQWVPVPTTIEWPCYLINNCSNGDWAPGEEPPGENVFGDFHTDQASWLIDPYQHIVPSGSDYSYDLTCGLIWSKSLVDWIATAPTTLGPLIPASQVYTIVIGTTVTMVSRTQSLEEITLTTGYTTLIRTNDKGVLFTETDMFIDASESLVWGSTTTITSTIPGVTSFISTRPAHRDAYFLSPFSFVPSSPCCSSCTLFGGTVQVFNWPTPAPEPPVSILVDPVNNFTFTSPSIYVAFQSLYATNLCGSLEAELITSTTIGFTAGELSTSQIFTVNGVVSTYMDFFTQGFTSGAWTESCTPITSTIYDELGVTFTDAAEAEAYSRTNTEWWVTDGIDTIYAATYTDTPLLNTYTVIHSPCSPFLSVPTLLYSLQPQWTGCVAGIDAFFDPIYTLTTSGAMGLVPQTTKGGAPVMPDETKGPSPGNTARPAVPPPTPAPTPTGKPQTHQDPRPEPNPGPDPQAAQPSDPTPTAPLPHLPPPSAFIVAGLILSAGGPAITVAGYTYSLQAGGSSVVIDATKSVPLASFLASPPVATDASASGGSTLSGADPNVNPDRQTASGAPGGNGIGYIFGSQTLQPGSQITISGEVISLANDGSSVVVVQLALPQTSSGVSNGGGSGTATLTEGVSALINGGASSTQSGQKLKQTGKSEGVRGKYTGHEGIYWGLGVIWGVWVVFGYL